MSTQWDILAPLEPLVKMILKLRAQEGCPWDRAQTPESLMPYLVEETHEIAEALHASSPAALIDELGDGLYLWLMFLLCIEEGGRGRVVDAVRQIIQKLEHRHPELTGPTTDGPDAGSWEMRKRAERPESAEVLGPLPASLPALTRAARLQEKAAGFGFDWPASEEVLAKVDEEVAELKVELGDPTRTAAAREELGDLLFSVVNLARHLGQDPEATLARATEKFRTRFNAMAVSLEADGHRLGGASLETMESHWQAIKKPPVSDNRRPDR